MFSEIERNRRMGEAAKLIKAEGLQAIYLVGNSNVGPNAFGCFRYFVDSRVFFHIMSVIIMPDGEPIAIVNNAMGKASLVANSFIRETAVSLDQLGGVIETLKSRGLTKGRLGVLLEILPASWLMRMKNELPELEFVDVSEKIFAIRSEKSPEEVEAQRVCAKIADAGYKALCDTVKPGMLENELVAEMDKAMQKLGAEESFMLISSGRFSASDNKLSTLHNTSALNRRIEMGDSVAAEITPRYNGYWTQIVRTISVGEYNSDADEFRRVVVGAIAAAKAKLRAGVPVCTIVNTMQEFIEGEGYKLLMPCGHIAAVDLNEERLTNDNMRPLAPGMLVIIHPTVVKGDLPTGIFWGESYIVTEDGYEAPMSSGSELYTSQG